MSKLLRITDRISCVRTVEGNSCSLAWARNVLRLFVMNPWTENSKGKIWIGKLRYFGCKNCLRFLYFSDLNLQEFSKFVSWQTVSSITKMLRFCTMTKSGAEVRLKYFDYRVGFCIVKVCIHGGILKVLRQDPLHYDGKESIVPLCVSV